MQQNNVTLNIQNQGPDQPLRISGTGNAYQAAELHSRLSGYLAEAPQPEIQLGELDGCDILTLQLLYSAVRTADKQQKQLRFSAVPDRVIQRCAEFGLPLPSSVGNLADSMRTRP